MLEYYKLALVRAGENKKIFRKVVRKALNELHEPHEKAALKDWFRGRLTEST